MNRVNYFTPYKSKTPNHEDQLTRAFLVLVRFIPLVSIGFIEQIREYLRTTKEGIPDNFPTLLSGDANLDVIATQAEKVPIHEVTDLIALMITDRKWKPEDFSIEKRKGKARYDGIIKIGQYVLTIENKPRHENIYHEQLNPNLDDNEVNYKHTPVVLYWEDIIRQVTSFLTRGLVSGLEEMLIRDFLEFAQREFWFINPFDNLALCQKNTNLISLRSLKLMEEIASADAVGYHRGSGNYLAIKQGGARQIWIGSDFSNSLNPKFYVDMYPGDALNQARYFYSNLDLSKLAAFMKKYDGQIELTTNLHFSFMSSNLVSAHTNLDTIKYLEFWKKHQSQLRQVKRDDSNSFKSYLEELLNLNMTSQDDLKNFEDCFEGTQRQTMNPCPGIRIHFFWNYPDAVKIDMKKRELSEKVKNIIIEMLDIWGQKFEPDSSSKNRD